MNLSQKVSQFRRDTIINEFKERYPEVYKWFNSEYFRSLFINTDIVSLRATYRDNFDVKTVLGLPFNDSEGVVDLDIIMEYLRSEGFLVKIDMGVHTSNLTRLVIQLGE